MTRRFKLLMLAFGIVLACTAAPILFTSRDGSKGDTKDFYIRAQQYTYTPHRIVVDQGDRVRIRLASTDVVHGFFLEGHDIEAMIFPGALPFYVRHPSEESTYNSIKEVLFTASRFGKFRYRCSVTCGPLHPFMLGEMVVRPNYPFVAGIGGLVGVFLAGFFLMFATWKYPSSRRAAGSPRPWRVDLLQKFPGLNWLVRRCWLSFALVLPTLALFFVFLIAGLFGSPIGNRNIIITFVWILWWFLLISFMLPLGGRVWCLMCPFPFFGEWFQRRRLLGPGPRSPDNRPFPMKGLDRKWPKALSNIWLQNFLFLALCTFSAALITRPIVSALALGGLVLIATVMHLIYRKRTFCNYVCPVSGFLGIYAMTSVIEVRAKDPAVCAGCKEKAGLVGNEQGWACPWAQNPSKMTRNNYCGLCMECIRACPNECMTLRARPFCSDVEIKGYDEAWKAFIMITIAAAYSVVLMGPWGILKEWANISEVGNWKGFVTYGGIMWFGALAAIPALWGLAAWSGRLLSGTETVSAKEIFLKYSYLLVPLGLVAWIAFSIPLILVNSTCILNTMSDPMGWGWDLFGTAKLPWTPILPEYAVYVQIPLLLIGLGFSLKRGYEIALGVYGDVIQGVRSLIPVGILCAGITTFFLGIFAR